MRLAVDKLLALLPPDRIIVVLGAYSDAVAQAVRDLPVKTVHNANWQQGLASSLKTGLNNVGPDSRAVLITLCDQALVSERCLRRLSHRWLTNPSEIVASGYADTVGTPAIIPAEFYPQIQALEGDTGAKSILKNNVDRVKTLSVPEAEFDIDMPADLEKLQL